MKQIHVLVFFVVLTQSIFGQGGFEWADYANATSLATGLQGCSVFNDGRVIIAGTFQGTVDIAGTSVTSVSASDVYVAMYDSAGVPQWTTTFEAGGTGVNCTVFDIQTNSAGEIIVGGRIKNDINIGGTYYPPVSSSRAFVAILDQFGSVIWSDVFGSATGNDYCTAVGVDDVGDFYVGGQFNSGFSIGSFPVTGSGVFLAKISSGIYQWVVQTSGGDPEIRDINTDGSGNVYFVGASAGAVTFGTTMSSGSSCGYMGMVDNAGNPVRIVSVASSSSFAMAHDLEVLSDGNLVVAGYYDSDVCFDTALVCVTNPPSGFHQVFYVARIDTVGDLVWANASTGLNGIVGPNLWDMDVDQNDNIYLAGEVSGLMQFDNQPVFGVSAQLDMAVFKFDSTGSIVWSRIGRGLGFSRIYGFGVDQYGSISIGGLYDDDFWLGNDTIYDLSGFGGYFVAKLTDIMNPNNQISGTVFYDFNGDGILNGADTVVAGHPVFANPTGWITLTDSVGYYTLYVDSNTHYVNVPIDQLNYWEVTSPVAGHVIPLNGSFLDTTGIDFGVRRIPNILDVRAVLTPYIAARPGFTTHYNITFENLGTIDSVAGSIQLIHDTALTYVSSSVPYSSYIGDTLTWNYSDLRYGFPESIDLEFNVFNDIALLGTDLVSVVTIDPIATDTMPENNIDSLFHTVTGSYDPNDKQVVPKGSGPLGEIDGWQLMTYTIRFQNTGTDTAFNIVIVDTIHENLDITTFTTTASSDPYTVDVREQGIVTWSFDNILLPDSNTNEPLSHGFVKFQIYPKSGLAIGEQFTNSASIFFDFNPPIYTNSTLNTIQSITVIPQASWVESIKVFPNPTTGTLMIEGNVSQVSIYDLHGRLLLEGTQNNFDISLFKNGVYIIHVISNGSVSVAKVIKH